MASALKTSRATPTGPDSTRTKSFGSRVYGLIDSIYHFLASLKLAVITLGSLAAVLGYATFFEASHGTAAVQEWIYRSRGFAVLLAFLGANILCAALIRYPWKRRQTGFVVTHAGLLILLGGSWYSVMKADEGEVAALEGEVKSELLRVDYPLIRVEKLDPHNPDAAVREWEFPFRPGAFAWGPGQPRPQSIFASLNPLNLFDHEDKSKPRDVLTRPNDPFQIVVKSQIPASVPATLHLPGPKGVPMAKIRPVFKGPGMPKARDVFEFDGDRWFVTDNRYYRVTKSRDPATGDPLPAQFVFLYLDRPEYVQDFLNPPAVKGEKGAVRLRYQDKAGKDRVYDWPLDGQDGKSVTLPDSSLSVTHLGVVVFPVAEYGAQGNLGQSSIPIAKFEVRQGDEAAVEYMSAAMLPMFPNIVPKADPKAGPPPKQLVSINYHLPPVLNPKSNGLFGVVEVLGTPEGKLYYRVFGRPKEGKLAGEVRDKGELPKGKETVAFGGNTNMPMTISFEVSDYLESGVTKSVCEPIVLPKNQMGNGLAASLVEMTVKEDGEDVTREFYLRRSRTFDPEWHTEVFPSGAYRIAYDMERKPLGFDVKLDDFEVTFDPGTDQASSYVSKVRLTDKAEGVNDKPVTISMNEPMKHKGFTFYQSNYIPEEDPRTHQKTGRFQSVFHVGYDPGRFLKYLGCILVVAGAGIQFYMRAGLFTDGGKRERKKDLARSAAPTHGDGITQETAPLAARRQSDDEEPL